MILYSRNDCPLCEEVEETLVKLGISFEFIDIDLDGQLKSLYHVRVPVLVNSKNQELNWPFEDDKLIAFSNK